MPNGNKPPDENLVSYFRGEDPAADVEEIEAIRDGFIEDATSFTPTERLVIDAVHNIADDNEP